MSRRRIGFFQNIILISLIVFIWAIHHLENKKNEQIKKLNLIGEKIIVSEPLKDCLKFNATPELRAAVKDVKAPDSNERTVTSIIGHYIALIESFSAAIYYDAYQTLDKCGVGMASTD